MEVLAIVLLIVAVVLVIMFMKKDKQLVGFYKHVGAYGRIGGFILVTCLWGCIAFLVYPFIMAKEIGTGPAILTAAIAEAICISVSILMLKRLFSKCTGLSKGRIVFDYIVIYFGTSIRVSLFMFIFITRAWLSTVEPEEYTVDGQTVYAYPGSDVLYDSHGYRVGVANSDRTKAVMDS